MEIDFHRYVLAENNTHRQLSKNGASSRAIPLKTAIQNVRDWKVEPLRWGANQAGMQAKDEEVADVDGVRKLWDELREITCDYVQRMGDLGLHKQWAARPLEAFAMMKMVETGTEWNNFYWLRDHDAAQPEMHELARCMKEAFDRSVPIQLRTGDWHVPYFKDGCWEDDSHSEKYLTHSWLVPDMLKEDHDGTKLQDALKISASCCAQVSYRKQDDTLQKAVDLYDRLVGADRLHFSPFEHQGTPVSYLNGTWPVGVTHKTQNGDLWSGNLRGWIQHRKMICIEKGLDPVTSLKPS